MTTATVTNPLDMSDEDIMNMSAPPKGEVEVSSTTTEQQAPVTEVVVTPPSTEETTTNVENTATTTSTENNNGSNIAAEAIEQEVKTPVQVETDKSKTSPNPATPAKEAPGTEAAKTETEPPAITPAVAVDYEGFYKKIMAPFRANGKTINLQTPDEAIQLMQMGANYTRKMQDIQPHRKVLMMLENNGLLDEGKLSFLIDVEKKNPEAIKKLIKDAGIDPLDLDTRTEPAYLEGNHRVTDSEVKFRTVLDELNSDPVGKETIKEIHNSWDQASKEVLWNDPAIMTTIHEQRANGIYAVITEELNRQRTLGIIPAGTPFLVAYKQVGDKLAAEAATKAGAPTTSSPAVGTTPPVVATRTAAPKPAVTNGDKVSAATLTRTTPRKASPIVNPLEMSDEDFLKQMNGRL